MSARLAPETYHCGTAEVVPSETSLYAILGVQRTADQDQIRAAYCVAIKQRHPDVDAGPRAHDTTIALIDAYAVLGNPESRQRYDLECLSRHDAHSDAERQSAAETRTVADRSSQPDGPGAILFHASGRAKESAVGRGSASRARRQRDDLRLLDRAVRAVLTARPRFADPVVGAAAVTLVLAIITGAMTVVFISEHSSVVLAPAAQIKTVAR